MHKTRRRRDDIILRVLTYTIMTMAVIFLAFICLFLVLGYNVNKETGRAEQGGLIQFRSFPSGAGVSLDNKTQGFNTAAKTNASATRHEVKMFKDKYRPWQKSFSLNRGELLWLNALLVPTSVTTNETIGFSSVSQAVASPDKKWIALTEKPGDMSLKIIDLRDEKQPKLTTLKIPETVAKAQTPGDTLQISEWDIGSRYFLVKHTSGQNEQWLRLDRTDEGNAKNLTSRYGLRFSEIHFTGNSGENFYTLSGGDLRKIQLNQSSRSVLATPMIASDVSDFDLYKDNQLALLSQKNNQQVVSVYKDSFTKPRTIETSPVTSPPLKIALSSFSGSDYLGVSQGATVRLLEHPFDKPNKVAEFNSPVNIQWLYFSNNGQFLVAQNGLNVTSYNLERKQSNQFTIPGVAAYDRPDRLQWLDDFHFWTDIGGTLRVFEFDGANPEVITNVIPGYGITLSDNGKRLFSIGANSATKQPVLQSSVMVVE